MKNAASWTTRVVALAGTAALLVGSGSAVLAENLDDGFWYFDTYGVQAAYDAGVTGAGVTIAVLDSPINLEIPALRGADIEVQPSQCWDASPVLTPPTSTSVGAAHHGTNVVSLIVGTGAGFPGQSGVKGVAPEAKILYFMVSPGDDAGNAVDCLDDRGLEYENSANALAVDSAVAKGAQIISVSLNVFPDVALVEAIARAEHAGVVIVGGLPNTDGVLNFGWPAAANGAVAVQRMDTNGVVPRVGEGPYDTRVVVAGPGEGVLTQGSIEDGSWESQKLGYGTSFATPVVAGFLALVKQKYPKATGNQLIQTLIHNTGAKDHPLEYKTEDGLGFGVASLTHMLKVDPTQYPDENPLISTDANLEPSAEMIANPPGVDTSTTSPTAPQEPTDSMSWVLPVAIGGIIFLLILVGVIVLVVVLASRRAKTPPATGTNF